MGLVLFNVHFVADITDFGTVLGSWLSLAKKQPSLSDFAAVLLIIHLFLFNILW